MAIGLTTRIISIVGTITIITIIVMRMDDTIQGMTMEAITAVGSIMVADIIDRKVHLILCCHGETEWSVDDRMASYSDLSLTKRGCKQALSLKSPLAALSLSKVFVSPMLSTQETCNLAGFEHHKVIDPDLMEWNFGAYEGLTLPQIFAKQGHWNLFNDGAPGGESPDEVSARAHRFLKCVHQEKAKPLLVFSHTYFCRILAMHWLELEPEFGKHFILSSGSLCMLGFDGKTPIIIRWNETFS